MSAVLVTGASGFLGAHVVRRLHKLGHQTLAAVRAGSSRWRLDDCPAVTWIDLDLRSPDAIREAVAKARPMAIVHCAAYGVDHREADLAQAVAINATAPGLLVEAAASYGVQRFIHVGTAYEYGDHAGLIAEDAPLRPRSLYGTTKAAGALIALERARTLRLPLSVIRPFGFYGPQESEGKLFPQIRAACRARTPLSLGAGNQVRDYLYVQDVARVVEIMLETQAFPEAEVFNIGSGRGVPLRDLILSAARAFGDEAFMRFGELPSRPNEVSSLVADIRKWVRWFGTPLELTPFEEGLQTMLVAQENTRIATT